MKLTWDSDGFVETDKTIVEIGGEGLPWPEEIQTVSTEISGIINNQSKIPENTNKFREPEIIYTRIGPVANRISVLLSNGTTIQLGTLKFSGIRQNLNGTFQKYK